MIFLPMLLACVSGTTRLMEIEISGEIEGADGPIYAQILVEEVGEGELAYPLFAFDAFTLDGPGAYAVTTRYPLDVGEGLALYAWSDLDGDEVLCGVGVDDEPSGLAIAAAVDFVVTLDLTLDDLCAGPEALY